MKRNHARQIIIDEEDFIDVLYDDTHPAHIITDKPEWIKKFISHNSEYGIPCDISWTEPTEKSYEEYVAECCDDWFMPDEYKNMDIHKYILGLCQTNEEKERVIYELKLFEEHQMINVLKFLKYFIDVLDKNKVMYGVGRGSSVASYILYLMGVHMVDSMKYNLDIKEFLRS